MMLLECVNIKLAFSIRYSKDIYSNRLFAFGEPILPDEKKCLYKILDKFPDATISIPVDDPILSFGNSSFYMVNLLDSTDWTEDIREKLKPAILDIFALQRMWTDQWKKRTEYETLRRRYQSIKDQLSHLNMSGEEEELFRAVCSTEAIKSLSLIREKLEKILYPYYNRDTKKGEDKN